jgi:hypothetical protein
VQTEIRPLNLFGIIATHHCKFHSFPVHQQAQDGAVVMYADEVFPSLQTNNKNPKDKQ